jgi:heme O synthase-like polyprenyltransferase
MTTRDLLTLTKFRLSALVIVTTFVGFWLRAPHGFDFWQLFHTIVGSTLAAFGAADHKKLQYRKNING